MDPVSDSPDPGPTLQTKKNWIRILAENLTATSFVADKIFVDKNGRNIETFENNFFSLLME